MNRISPILFCLYVAMAGLLSACSGEPAMNKAILGTWVQETPISMTSEGLQTTTADTVLRLKKNGETHLSRNLDIKGQGLPAAGIQVSVELRGRWELRENQLLQSPTSVIIMPRDNEDISRQWADKLQAQAESSPPSLKIVVSADRTQLILQDAESGATDVYSRK